MFDSNITRKNKINFLKSSGMAGFLVSILLFLVYALSGCNTRDAAGAAIGTATAGFVGAYICFIVLAWAAGVFFFVVWIIALVDCARRDYMDFPNADGNTKVMWILIIVLAGGIGAIIYYFLVMRKMPRKK